MVYVISLLVAFAWLRWVLVFIYTKCVVGYVRYIGKLCLMEVDGGWQ